MYRTYPGARRRHAWALRLRALREIAARPLVVMLREVAAPTLARARRNQSGNLNNRRLLAVACAAMAATSSPFSSATAFATNGSSAGSL